MSNYPTQDVPPPFPQPPQPRYQLAPPARRSFAGAIFTTLATIVLGLSITLNIYLLAYAGIMSGAGSVRANELRPGDATQKIVVIPVRGVLMERQATQLARLLRQAEADTNVRALVLDIDTPGGSVTASDQMYRAVLDFKARKNVPVIIAQGGLATSGGYYLSAAGDHIFAQPTTLTGNIGVIASSLNFAGLMEKYGVKDATVTSSGSDFKDSGSAFRPERPQDRKYIQELIDGMFDQFTGIVAVGRKGKLTAGTDVYASGKAFNADQALKLGLIDAIGYLSDAYGYAATTAGLTNPRVVELRPTPSFADILSGAEVKSPAPGININFDPSTLYELQSPQFLYLWRPQ
jgi:protease-4